MGLFCIYVTVFTKHHVEVYQKVAYIGRAGNFSWHLTTKLCKTFSQ